LSERALRILLVGWIALSLAACGFRLAGTAQLPPSMESIRLLATDFNSAQQAQLVRRLEQAGARVSDAETDAAARLAVRLRAIPDRDLVSSASSGRNVRRITRELDYRVTSAAGFVLAESTTLSQSRDFTANEDSLHASNREREEVIKDLEQALFNQLVYQLQRL